MTNCKHCGHAIWLDNGTWTHIDTDRVHCWDKKGTATP